jgi:tripartite-type tricarboxylate transporter receptor subunit TctC
MLARLVSNAASSALGQPLVVEKRPGANGVVASQALLAAPVDGHAVLLATADTHTLLPAANPRLPFDPGAFQPVTALANVVFGLVARPGLGVENVAQLAERVRRAATPLTYASYGYATVAHVAGEMLRRALGVEMTHVPYPGGGPAALAVSAGQVDIAVLPVAVAVAQRPRIAILGVASAARFGLVPDVPTLREQGVDVLADAWIGLLAAPRVPREVIVAQHDAFGRALRDPAVPGSLEQNGFAPLGQGLSDFGDLLRQESLRWGAAVRGAAIRVDG